MIETALFFLFTIPVLLISWKLSQFSFRSESIKFLYALMNIFIGSNYFSIAVNSQPPTLFFGSLSVDFTGNYLVTASSIVTMILLIKFIPKRHD